MIRKLYLKKPMVNATGDTYQADIRNGLTDLKITNNDHGSQRSLFKDKMRDKDCSCM